nr:ATP-binding protein [Terrimicrobiaceae bacterium]
IGHEIRTPMNGLLGFASLLEKTDLSDEQKEYLATLRLSGEALLRILEDILDYSRLEYETLQIKSVPVDIREVVTQVSQLFVMALGDRNLELVTKLDPELPGQVLADDVRLRQILVNLVGNAIKFTEEGFILIKTVRESLEGREYVVFHVVDSGPGVSPDMIDRLFKPFSQVDSTITRRFGGTGLGLSICKRLVETMGGEIGVNTAPGKGSDFYFSLPLRVPEFPAKQVLPARQLLSGLPDSLRILVVDDDPINRKLICRMIEKIGAKPVLAESGSQAVRAFKEGEFDLILMDMQMPGMDGLETTRRIRAIENEAGLGQRTPISALTANSADRDRELCFEAGMDDFLCKPVRIDDLERLIGKNTA